MRFSTSSILTAALLLAASLPAFATENSMVIKYVNRGETDARHSYKFELIKLILDVTKSKYGSYHIEPYVRDPGSKRQAALISEGEQINLLWASPGTTIAEANAIEIPIDILRGLLGHRICLINASDQTLFESVTDKKTLKGIRIGQSSGWEDLKVYSANDLTTIQATTYEGLFGMLYFKRFECLALGADEITQAFHEKSAFSPQLAIEESLIIKYDYPIYFYVSSKHPTIAKRILDGLKIIQSTDQFNQLFNRYFRRNIEKLHLHKRKIICLESPFLPQKNQCNKSKINLLPNDKLFK